ncbi:MAG TPA: hypothetical protein VGX24_12115 [Pyrinomonadaceae bacterium]|jgi:hypothetical protein|nr:hypothetical protein [Pyrinomonadaceae bacterium]
MNSTFEDAEAVRQYLLGMLPQEKYLHIEEQFLTSNDRFEELLIAEDELIDEYLRGELSEAERKHFTDHFLQSPERQQKLRFAKTFDKYIEAAKIEKPHQATRSISQVVPGSSALRYLFPVRSPIATLSLATAVLLLLLGTSWVLISKLQMREEGPRNSVVLALTPRLVRDIGETNKIVITADVHTVRLRLMLPADDYQTYRAVLRSSEETEIWTGDKLIANTSGDGKYIEYELPARLLKADDYKITLSGNLTEDKYEDITHYSFRVAK